MERTNLLGGVPHVVILGSGKSINDLSNIELKFINESKVKIALNKFGAFYEKAKITPTHVFFYDDYEKSSVLFLKYIIKKFRKDKVQEITFIISKRYKGYLFRNGFKKTLVKSYVCLLFGFKKVILKLARMTIKSISVSLFNSIKPILGKEESIDFLKFSVVPKNSKLHYIDVQAWDKKGNSWAKNIDESLYHFRGSFTTVLNYISILYPNHRIILAGVDFDGFGYFFSQEKLDELLFETSDWTTQIAKKNNKHFSIINYNGTKMDDELPFVLEKLKQSGNEILCLNKKSYLVKKGFVRYFDLVREGVKY